MENKRVKHPSYGYATAAEIEKLKTANHEEKMRILKSIEAKTRGRRK